MAACGDRPPFFALRFPAGPCLALSDQVTKGVQSLVAVDRAHPELRAFKVKNQCQHECSNRRRRRRRCHFLAAELRATPQAVTGARLSTCGPLNMFFSFAGAHYLFRLSILLCSDGKTFLFRWRALPVTAVHCSVRTVKPPWNDFLKSTADIDGGVKTRTRVCIVFIEV